MLRRVFMGGIDAALEVVEQRDFIPDVRGAVIHIHGEQRAAQHHAVFVATFPEVTANKAAHILDAVPLTLFQQLGEVDVRRNGDAPGFHSEAAVSAGILLVAFCIPSQRRADIHHRAEGSERLGLLLDLRQCLIGGGVVIPLAIEFIDSHLGHLSLYCKNRRHSHLPGAKAPMPKWAFAP